MFNFKQLNWQRVAAFLFVLSMFTLPLSMTLKSITLIGGLLAASLSPDLRQDMVKIIREPWFYAILTLFTLVLLGSITGIADWKSKLIFINKYSKFLFIPFIALAFQHPRLRWLAIHAFLGAMTITLLISFLKALSWVTMNPVNDPGAVFHNHIVTGFYMAFAAFLSANLARTPKKTPLRLGYAALALLFSYQTLFINTGRTGYVIYSLLLILFLWQSIPARKMPLYIIIILPCALLVAYHSMALNTGVKAIVHDVQNYQEGNNKNTSVGFRLQFHQYAKKLFLAHPVWGTGTAGFTYSYRQEQPIPAWGKNLLDPHNQYWLIAAEYGVIGLLVLAVFFLAFFYACRNLKDMRPLMIALLCSFIVANLSDSFLLFSNTGDFLVFFAAIALGESLEKNPSPRRDSIALGNTVC
ncbi:O-antigen ligase family protein [Legionella erythra]|uniref:O-antigen biosynthesis protein n=1 Tax=Legionella erythra TaxID=448 RepID=A0A0W0TSL0_LEGER|nr:O-antigen ligase family protein [Legionella erythra]KTC98673.1 O-antigen biosynthesis protein [Legionella erythra]